MAQDDLDLDVEHVAMYEVCGDIGAPLVTYPNGVEEIINLTPDRINALADLRTVNSYAYALAQYLIYLQQQYNIYKAIATKLETVAQLKYAERLSGLDNEDKRSVSEKKALAMNDPQVRHAQEIANEASMRALLLDGIVDRCTELLNILKRVHDDLAREKFTLQKDL